MRATCGLDFAIQHGEAVADIDLRDGQASPIYCSYNCSDLETQVVSSPSV